MDIERAVKESGVIPHDRVGSLLASLQRIPDFSWVLISPHPTELRLQGDVLTTFPVAFVDDTGKPRCKDCTVLVMNNTCDLQPNRSQFVTVAPAFDFEEFAETVITKRGEHDSRSYLRDVMANNICDLLWLPPCGSFRKGAVVFLERLGAVSAKLYEEAVNRQRRIASFSQNGFYFLLIKITNHVARMESAEVTRQS